MTRYSDNRPSMTLFQQRVRIFCVLAETGSFTKAAGELHMSQSAVSRIISEFETDLSVRLFDHTVRPIRLTSAGIALKRLVEQHLDEIDDQVGMLQWENMLKSPLKIGFVESIARLMSWTIIKSVRKDVSSVTILTGISRYLLSLLDADKLDVILSPDPFAHRNDLDRRFIFREPSIIVLPQNSGLPNTPTWQQLQFYKLPFLHYSQDNSGGRLDQKFFGKLGIQFPQRLSVDINAVMLDYIAHGEGWTLTRPTSLLQHPDLSMLVDVRPMPEPLASRELYVITRRGFNSDLADKITQSAVNCFVQKVAPEMIKKTPWIEPYLFCRGKRENERIPVFANTPTSSKKMYSSNDVYIL